MLELLGFIALIAIIFGVSMTAAVGIIVKVVLWIIGVCIAFAIVGKMQASTARGFAWVAIIIGGILLAGLDAFQNTTYAPCFRITDVSKFGVGPYEVCMSEAAKTVEARVSTAIWLIVIGIVLLIAAWVKGGSSNNDVNNAGINAGKTEKRKTKGQKEVRVKAEVMEMTIVNESQARKEKMADLAKQLLSLKKKTLFGVWTTCISFVLGPILYLSVIFFFANEFFCFFDAYPVAHGIVASISVAGILIFPFFLALTPYWIISYKRTRKELEELKSAQRNKKKENK